MQKISFCSVKGGTGKSTLSLVTALSLFRQGHKVLFGQDSGSFRVKENSKENADQDLKPYAIFFDDFIPFMIEKGIDFELINEIITKNSHKALSLE